MGFARVKTGVADLNTVLRGGFPANTTNVIMGAPGTGKTILAEQLVFANASENEPAVFFTTLSEPLEKFIEHGQSYGFFDPDKVGEAIFYEDLGSMVRERGIDALAEIVAEVIAQRHPRLIVIDSFKALIELMESAHQHRTVVFDLASVLASYQCTTFLVGEYAEEMMTALPEFAIADGIVSMIKQSNGVRVQRFLKIEKLRGADSVEGMHAFDIDEDGISVYPRLLTPLESPSYTVKVERINTGISGLDNMIEKGFWRGSTTLVAGPTGSGKTIIGLHFIREGVLNNEPAVFVGFEENPIQLRRIMAHFNWDPNELLKDPNFELMYRSPVELQLDSVATELFRRVREGRARRVVIDALGELQNNSSDARRFSDFIYALTQWFAVENVTCLMMLELHELFTAPRLSDSEISNMSDNVLLLSFVPGSEMTRAIRILKTRASAHDHRLHALKISNHGMEVGAAL